MPASLCSVFGCFCVLVAGLNNVSSLSDELHATALQVHTVHSKLPPWHSRLCGELMQAPSCCMKHLPCFQPAPCSATATKKTLIKFVN